MPVMCRCDGYMELPQLRRAQRGLDERRHWLRARFSVKLATEAGVHLAVELSQQGDAREDSCQRLVNYNFRREQPGRHQPNAQVQAAQPLKARQGREDADDIAESRSCVSQSRSGGPLAATM